MNYPKELNITKSDMISIWASLWAVRGVLLLKIRPLFTHEAQRFVAAILSLSLSLSHRGSTDTNNWFSMCLSS